MTNKYIQRDYFTMSECGISPGTIVDLTGIDATPLVTKFIDLFFTEYSDNWIVFEDRVTNEWEELPVIAQPSDKVIDSWKSRFSFTFKTTYERYAKLIELYDSQKENLLNKIESATKSVFNDTPQDKNNVVTDGFNTTITTNNTSVDPGEVINRLKNIERNYKDIYKDWIDEFAYLFGEAI